VAPVKAEGGGELAACFLCWVAAGLTAGDTDAYRNIGIPLIARVVMACVNELDFGHDT